MADEQTLTDKLATIEKAEKAILEMFVAFLKPAGEFYVADLVLYGVANRALSLSAGFREMITARRFTCAAPLLRMQLDTAMRLYAARLVDVPAAYADHIFRGKPTSKFNDRDGKPLTDSYMARRMSEDYPWVHRVYKETSEFVHFTSRHIFSAALLADEEERRVDLFISGKDRERPESDYFEIVHAFHHTTHVVATFAAEWHSAIHPDHQFKVVITDDEPEPSREIIPPSSS